MTPPILAALFCPACHAKYEPGTKDDGASDAVFFPREKITDAMARAIEQDREGVACPRCGARASARVEPDAPAA